MKTDEQLREYLQSHPGITADAVQNNLWRHSLTVARIKAIMAEVSGAAPSPTAASVSPRIAPKPFSHLLEQFDDVAKVQKSMRGLKKSEFLDDEAMRQSLGINTLRWRDVREDSRLQALRIKLPTGKYAWMHAEAQQALTAAINLSSS